jgi:hypothetical protein
MLAYEGGLSITRSHPENLFLILFPQNVSVINYVKIRDLSDRKEHKIQNPLPNNERLHIIHNQRFIIQLYFL